LIPIFWIQLTSWSFLQNSAACFDEVLRYILDFYLGKLRGYTQQSYGLNNILKKVWITHILIRTTWKSYKLFRIRREQVSRQLKNVRERPLSLLTAHRHYFKILVKQKLLSPLRMKLEITIEAS
jgi:hypothetical protein